MDKATRERALRLLSEKKSDPGITYSDIEVETGYSRRQLIRLSKRLDEDGADTERFASAKKVLAFAGCDPSVFESGEFTGTRAHLSKRGSPHLRWYLWLAAERARMNDPVLRAYYLKKRSEGKCHKVAVTAVIRKLVSILYAVLRDGTAYVCPAH